MYIDESLLSRCPHCGYSSPTGTIHYDTCYYSAASAAKREADAASTAMAEAIAAEVAKQLNKTKNETLIP